MQFLKIISSYLLIIASLSFIGSPVFAADLSISAGGGAWYIEGDGDLRYKDYSTVDVDDLDYDKELRGYVWAELRHPVPVLPNIRIEYVDLKFSGHSSEGFTWEDVRFKADAYSKTSLSQLDMIIFYNIVSLPWVGLDLGADVKYLNFKFDATGKGISLDDPTIVEEYSVNADETLYVPFVYGRTRFDIPATNFGVEADLKYVEYKSTSLLDTSIKANYLFNFKAFRLGAEVGYRFESIDIDQDDFSGLDYDINVDLKGLFAGAVIKF